MKKNIVFRLLRVLMVLICTFTLVSVNSFAVSKATLNKTSIKMVVGAASTLKVTGATETVKWSSSDKAIATVSSKGKVTAKSKGTCYIYAKFGKTTLKCKVTVLTGAIKVDKTSVTLTDVGKSTTIKGSFGGKGQTIKIANKNQDIVSVKATTSGKNFTLKVTSKKAGTAQIVVSLKDAPSIKKTITVKVNKEVAIFEEETDYEYYYDEYGNLVIRTNFSWGAVDTDASNNSSTSTSDMAKEVWELANKERAARGTHALEYDDDLNKIAMARAKEITEKFSHTRPNGTSCFTAFDEIGENDYSTKSMGENIAMGQVDAADAMKSWMASTEGHKEAILNSKYNKIGVGCFKYNGRYYWVQVFSN